MKTKQIISALIISTAFLACNNAKYDSNEKAYAHETVDSVLINKEKSVDNGSSSAAVENQNNKSRKFIRTADIKFKVKDVVQSTYQIEDVVKTNGGFVTYTNLNSDVNEVSHTAISSDSTLEATTFTVNNSITLRVPNFKLDTTLKEIAKTVDFLDSRLIKADDVALQLLANDLTQKRTSKSGSRLANSIDKKGNKLKDVVSAEDEVLNKETVTDESKIANLDIQDKIAYSTVTLYIYQKPTIKSSIIANKPNIEAYEPGFISQLKESFLFGGDILAQFIVFLTKLWALALFGVLAYIGYRKYGFKLKKAIS